MASFLLAVFASSVGNGQAAMTALVESWSDAGFTNIESSAVDTASMAHANPTTHYTHAFGFTVVVLKHIGWQYDSVLEMIRKTTVIYGKCGIKISRTTLIMADFPTGFKNMDKYGWQQQFRQEDEMSKIIPHDHGFTVFFIGKKQGRLSYAFTPSGTYDQPTLVDTAWITAYHQTAKLDATYSPIAHELFHLLTDNPAHLQDGKPNLMANEMRLLTGDLRAEQCEQLKAKANANAKEGQGLWPIP